MGRVCWVGPVVAAVVFCMFGAPLDAADDLERQLLRTAPVVMKALKEKGYKNVGVLKFRVKNGTAAATDRQGTLNQRLAQKLELALILANKVSDPVGILRNASATAATIDGATHLTRDGRAKLFTRDYPLAWGTSRVVPDAFLTGAAAITTDLASMTVVVTSFDSQQLELEEIARFDVKLDLEDLLDSGESFTLRGVFDNSSLKMTEDERKEKASSEARVASLTTKSETEAAKAPIASKLHPLSPQNADAPVTLEILYDGKPQPIEFRGGAAFVPEPQERQRVTLVVRRKGATTGRLGVVVKVNGENTLYRQKEPDPQCASWILTPERKEVRIEGYQEDEKTLKQFRVLSQPESKAREIDYGEFVGAISISVFKERTVAPKPPALDLALTDEGEDFDILKKGIQPDSAPANPGALRQQLAQAVSTRGLIAQGDAVDRQVMTTAFEKDTVPVMSATVKYYNAQDLPD
jgi:hypothetical protein